MESPPTVRDRIFNAADRLYEDSGRQTFPTVDAVRKLAKVNMNDASTGMREWRRAQATQIATMALQAPEVLQRSSTTALAALWSEAVNLANETLRAAEAGWAAERSEAEALREQMANAHEAVERELESAHGELAELRTELGVANSEAAELRKRIEIMVRDLGEAVAAAKESEARKAEIALRVSDLRSELERAHEANARTAAQLAAERTAHFREAAGFRAEVERNREDAQRLAEDFQTSLCKARENAATLQGKLDALSSPQTQVRSSKPHPRKKPDGHAGK